MIDFDMIGQQLMDELDLKRNAGDNNTNKKGDSKRKKPKLVDQQKNQGFIQLYNKGIGVMDELIKKNPSAARVYMALAQQMDHSTGSIIVFPEVVAQELDISERTARRALKFLEDENCVIKLKLRAGVYLYALDPEMVWKGSSMRKDSCTFRTSVNIDIKKLRDSDLVKFAPKSMKW